MITQEIQQALKELKDNTKKFGNVSSQLSKLGYSFKEIEQSVVEIVKKINELLNTLKDLDLESLQEDNKQLRSDLDNINTIIKEKKVELENIFEEILRKLEIVEDEINRELNMFNRRLQKKYDEIILSLDEIILQAQKEYIDKKINLLHNKLTENKEKIETLNAQNKQLKILLLIAIAISLISAILFS